MHSPHTEEWTLRIRFAQKKDSGIYECQISTTPPSGHSVYLKVVGMSVFIIEKTVSDVNVKNTDSQQNYMSKPLFTSIITY